jgi:hypothetical protein
VGTVGIGTGGCTIIFSIIDVLFIRPLPHPEADRVFLIQNSAWENRHPPSVVDHQAIADLQTTFEAMATFNFNTFTFQTPDEASQFPKSELRRSTANGSDAIPSKQAAVIESLWTSSPV